MLYISLIASIILLVVVNLIVAKARYPALGVIACCGAFAFGPVCLMLFFPPVGIQALFLCVLLPVLLVPDRGRRLYPPFSCIATVAAYLILVNSAINRHRETAQLRREYPLESIEKRLPIRVRGEPSPQVDADRLERLESGIDQERWGHYYSRDQQLMMLHEGSVNDFVNSAGFGVGRMGSMLQGVTAESLEKGLRDAPPVPQPDYLSPFVRPEGLLTDRPANWDAKGMSRLHDDGVLDFVNPRGFGYVKDRLHVAGFRSHGMSKLQTASSSWVIARIELVGLLVHEQPVVYLSTNLPRMDELRGAPTRPPDGFETEALKSLRSGEDLFVRGNGDTARMLGAIRAAKQCLGCHGGSRGDLLGAFSYGFRVKQDVADSQTQRK